MMPWSEVEVDADVESAYRFGLVEDREASRKSMKEMLLMVVGRLQTWRSESGRGELARLRCGHGRRKEKAGRGAEYLRSLFFDRVWVGR